MALIWPKHGPNMVLLIEHNIDMSLGPISLNPESFSSLVCIQSQLQVRLVNYPLTNTRTLVSLELSPYGGQLKTLTENSQEEAIKIINRNIREVINHINKARIVKLTNSNFPKDAKTLKNIYNETQYNNSCNNWISNEIGINDYYEMYSDDEGKIEKTKP